jgi:hypothetical protein
LTLASSQVRVTTPLARRLIEYTVASLDFEVTDTV